MPTMGLVVTLVVIGAVLMLLEVFLPGMIAGLVGFGCLVAAIIVGYVEFGARGGNLFLVGVTFLLVTAACLWMRYFPNSRLGRIFVSQRVIGNIDAEKHELLHRTGTALTILRPSGMALIDGRRVDVVTEGPLLEAGTPVKVIAVEGMRVVVRAAEPVATPIPDSTQNA